MQEDSEDREDEWLYDEVTGNKRKVAMSILNKSKLTKYELDELFSEE